MSNVDWNDAPNLATHCIDGSFTFWSAGTEYTWEFDEWVKNANQWSLEKYAKKDIFEIIERPDEWQEGEERMNNIGQNGNDGHYDAVNNPEHYQSESGIECIDAIRASLGLDGFVAYCRGNAIKYSWRSGQKSEHAEDLRKAAWYLERAASELEKVSE